MQSLGILAFTDKSGLEPSTPCVALPAITHARVLNLLDGTTMSPSRVLTPQTPESAPESAVHEFMVGLGVWIDGRVNGRWVDGWVRGGGWTMVCG